jgi:hypothetical protein
MQDMVIPAYWVAHMKMPLPVSVMGMAGWMPE